MWEVYGKGIGAQPEGVIFKYVTWIDAFPENLNYSYAMDFGWTTDPTGIIKCALNGNNLYYEELCYEPIDNPQAMSEMMVGIGMSRQLQIVADSSDKYISQKYGSMEMVKDLKKLGWNIHKVSKTHDVVYWIQKMKECKIHIVRTVKKPDGTIGKSNFIKEQQNYRWRQVMVFRLISLLINTIIYLTLQDIFLWI